MIHVKRAKKRSEVIEHIEITLAMSAALLIGWILPFTIFTGTPNAVGGAAGSISCVSIVATSARWRSPGKPAGMRN
ncbi:hypothetical protein [Burkholderia ubonensis]|uniref:hypothetical protein n=1 Tax=Burkholderia ubonensis TaxID=101571 RepID=UPI0018DEF3DE|nr:hypothetical protein [Burkholderia ubonensis]